MSSRVALVAAKGAQAEGRYVRQVMDANQLFYGDNLDILRRYVGDEIVDLVYLDPPFKSNQNYNVLFAERDGTQAAAQIVRRRGRVR